jgi:AcrR family transcriptional regulator
MELTKTSTKPRRELVRQELLTKAAEVFETKGYAQTTIQDVAQALALSRSALYHYFESKDDILLALVEDHASAAADRMRKALATSQGSTIDKLQLLLSTTIRSRMTGGARLRVLDQLAAEMPPAIRVRFERGRREVLDLYTGLIRSGIEAGELRQVDARLAALAIIGIASWTSWWYSPTGRKAPDELAAALIDIAFHGLIGPESGPPQPRSSRQMIRSIKRSLDVLEKSLDDGRD